MVVAKGVESQGIKHGEWKFTGLGITLTPKPPLCVAKAVIGRYKYPYYRL
ncbi:MAG: hypothetical protein FWE28_04455 [Oscillospiraceae bacterium]|nr:hypothetical protein [Oscillospiraceae bacterium]